MKINIVRQKQKAHFKKKGYPNAQFSPFEPVGKNTIALMFKDASRRIGCETTGHAFRRLFITTLVNTPGVSTEEALASSRHSSVASQRPYMVRGKDSESAKLKALGFTGKSDPNEEDS